VYEGLSEQNILSIAIAILQHTTSTTSIFTSPDVTTDPFRSVISLGQQSTVMYLGLKGLDAVEIHNNLVSTLKSEANSDSTGTYYLHKPSFSSPKIPRPSESPAPILNESDEAILLALSEDLFPSVRKLARRTYLHSSTVYDYPIHKLGFTVRYLCWVPHLLSEADKHPRAHLSFDRFEMLQHQTYKA
jgi:hypothetical protein